MSGEFLDDPRTGEIPSELTTTATEVFEGTPPKATADGPKAGYDTHIFVPTLPCPTFGGE